jgi:Putative transposase
VLDAARAWLERPQADLLPVPYYHVVCTLPAVVAAVAFQNKAVVYDLLFRTAADTLLTIAADPKHLGAKIGLTAVLHTWGSAMTHHPHVHIVVPGGGLSPDGARWTACRPRFFLCKGRTNFRPPWRSKTRPRTADSLNDEGARSGLFIVCRGS